MIDRIVAVQGSGQSNRRLMPFFLSAFALTLPLWLAACFPVS